MPGMVMEIGDKELRKIGEYVRGHLEEWIRGTTDIRFESLDKRFVSLDKRFEMLQRYMDKRFSQMQWTMGLGFTMIVMLMGVFNFF